MTDPPAPSARRPLGGLLRAARPRQWTKNVLVFVAPAAAGVLTHRTEFLRALGAFALFCVVASGMYLINDALDAEADRHHPKKRLRPVAAGQVSEGLAFAVGLVLAAVAVTLSGVLYSGALAAVFGAYVVISLAYSLRLKREPVVELACVASGFVLRALAGGVATKVPFSNWFLVVMSFGALFVVVGKRSAEHQALSEDRGRHRPVLEAYTSSFLQSALTLTATVTVTGYCLWAFDRAGVLAHTHRHQVWVELTVVPVVLSVLYVLRLLDAGQGGSPEELVFYDRFLQVMAVAWAALFAVGLYG